VDELVQQLGLEAQSRYRALEKRCRAILDQQRTGMMPSGAEAQGEGLGRLLWLYLRLLLTRQAIDRVVLQSAAPGEEGSRLEERIRKLESQLAAKSVGEELRRSLTGQIEILKQRLQKRSEARDKLEFLDAELTRLQEQVELIREQAVLATDPQTVSERIDQITATLEGTSQWIREQQQIYGATEDLLAEAPALSVKAAERQ
jgi:chromosome segregation ATPase